MHGKSFPEPILRNRCDGLEPVLEWKTVRKRGVGADFSSMAVVFKAMDQKSVRVRGRAQQAARTGSSPEPLPLRVLKHGAVQGVSGRGGRDPDPEWPPCVTPAAGEMR